MTTKILEIHKKIKMDKGGVPWHRLELDAWLHIRGLWKNRKLDALKYQKNIRAEAER